MYMYVSTYACVWNTHSSTGQNKKYAAQGVLYLPILLYHYLVCSSSEEDYQLELQWMAQTQYQLSSILVHIRHVQYTHEDYIRMYIL